MKLNKRAFEILKDGVERCATNDAIGKTEKLIVMKRLEKLRQEKGIITIDELRDTTTSYPEAQQLLVMAQKRL